MAIKRYSIIEKNITEILRNNPTSPDNLIKLLIEKGHTDKNARATAWTMLGQGRIIPNRYMRLKLAEELLDV